MRQFFYLAMITLAICVLNPHALRAQEDGVLKQFEPLRLLFVDPSKAEFFFDFAVSATDSFRKGQGVHHFGYGGAVSFSWAAYQNRAIRFRPALDLVVMRSTKSGVNRNINALDFTSTLIFYLDQKIKSFRPFIGVGGGYLYLLDKQAGTKASGGVYVFVGDVGASFKLNRNRPWAIFFAYRYLLGLNKKEFSTRQTKLNASAHNIRVGVRVNF